MNCCKNQAHKFFDLNIENIPRNLIFERLFYEDIVVYDRISRSSSFTGVILLTQIRGLEKNIYLKIYRLQKQNLSNERTNEIEGPLEEKDILHGFWQE